MYFEWQFTECLLFFLSIVLVFRAEGLFSLASVASGRLLAHVSNVARQRSVSHKDEDFYCFFHAHALNGS
ncbi:MAG: hypothetical protein KKE73_16855 [Proteobacteria bacterium]|nr:hypothetical protein [Pseudomonadota bacterium]